MKLNIDVLFLLKHLSLEKKLFFTITVLNVITNDTF
jgi:hypothetical protein